MTPKSYAIISALIFGAIAVEHTVRLVLRGSIVVEGWPVPLWISPVVIIVGGFLSYQGFRLSRR